MDVAKGEPTTIRRSAPEPYILDLCHLVVMLPRWRDVESNSNEKRFRRSGPFFFLPYANFKVLPLPLSSNLGIPTNSLGAG